MVMIRMRVLTELEYQIEAHHAFRSVFRSADPFDEPIAPSVSHRAILYPVSYDLEPHEFGAIALAAQTVGDNSFYFSVTERPMATEQDRPYHWLIPFEELSGYRSLGYPFVLENAFYSPNGHWGVLISHEQHAVVAGSKQFLDTLFTHLPVSAELQIQEFLSTWKDNHTRLGSKIDWLPRLLRHVYGVEQAELLLQKME